MSGVLELLLHLNPLWIVGVLVGIIFVMLLRARQIWSARRAFGYDVYTADSLRQRLQRWAMISIGVLVAISALYFWRLSASTGRRPNPTAIPPTATPPLEALQLVIPRLAVETSIIEAPIVENDWDISTLTTEVAHLAGTAYPGQAGNSVLVGHITIPNAGWGPFQELDTLEIGDQVFIRYGHEEYSYEVFDIRSVPPTSVEVAYTTDDTRLTLLTCTTWDDLLETYTERLAVAAKPIENP